MMFRRFLLLSALMIGTTAVADDLVLKLSVKESGFEPAQLEAPAGQAFVIEVSNQGAKAIEFESKQLRIEKIVPPGKTSQFKVKPLRPGSYKFVNEFDEDKVKGVVVVK